MIFISGIYLCGFDANVFFTRLSNHGNANIIYTFLSIIYTYLLVQTNSIYLSNNHEGDITANERERNLFKS